MNLLSLNLQVLNHIQNKSRNKLLFTLIFLMWTTAIFANTIQLVDMSLDKVQDKSIDEIVATKTENYKDNFTTPGTNKISLKTPLSKSTGPTSSLTEVSICEGESFLFNGIYYSTDGEFTIIHLINIEGQDSTATLHLTVNKHTASTTEAQICKGENFNFNGNTFSTEGIYTFHLTNAAGCDSIATLNLKVSEPTTSFKTDTICEGSNYLFCGNIYNQSGIFTDTLVNISGCDSIATLNLTVLNSSESILNVSLCAGDSIFFNGGFYKISGTYNYHLTNHVGCDSLAVLSLNVLQPLTSITNAHICSGSSYFFNGNYYSSSGVYTSHFTGINGCDSVSVLNLVVHFPSDSIINATICDGEAYFFNGSYFNSEGVYEVHLNSKYGCDSTAVLNLTVHKSSESISIATVCKGEKYAFNGNVYDSEGVYTNHLLNINGCDSSVILKLYVIQPTSSVTNATICKGESFKFNDEDFQSDGIYTKHFLNVMGCDSSAVLNLKVLEPTKSVTNLNVCEGDSVLFNNNYYSIAGIYEIKLKNSLGCDSIAVLNLTATKPGIAQINDTVYQNQSYKKNGFLLPVQTTPGDYKFTKVLTSVSGCDSIVTLNLYVSPVFSVSMHSIPSICSGDKFFTISFNIDYGMIESYSVLFDEKSTKSGFTDIISNPLYDLNLNVSIPVNIIPDYYHARVIFNNHDFSRIYDVAFQINYSSGIIMQKWNDVLAVYNSNFNGGFEFVEFQWYKNGEIIQGANKSYLYMSGGDLDSLSAYSVKLTRSTDNVILYTCPFIPVIKKDIKIYPTIIEKKSEFSIDADSKARAVLTNISGVKLKEQTLIAGKNKMYSPDLAGAYLLLIINEDGNTFQQSIIVK